jgi:hypothetical protein
MTRVHHCASAYDLEPLWIEAANAAELRRCALFDKTWSSPIFPKYLETFKPSNERPGFRRTLAMFAHLILSFGRHIIYVIFGQARTSYPQCKTLKGPSESYSPVIQRSLPSVCGQVDSSHVLRNVPVNVCTSAWEDFLTSNTAAETRGEVTSVC